MNEKDDQEQLELPKEYKKGYNHADLVINQFPKLLENMKTPDGEHSDYTRGFEDRVEVYKRDMGLNRDFEEKEIKEKYLKEHSEKDNESIDKDARDRG
ncbi:hypothetical protein [Marinoscillum sp.]|uniref:hypothetical protein n=1 Tax=Marinoscillum sp. TaxID=2024838 RepID=UPI003BAD0634